jgi:dipeptidyl aminopeptidase/acylaminoacyl peptidase
LGFAPATRAVALAVLLPGAWIAGWAQDSHVDRGGDGSAGKRPITFADLQRMKRVSDPQISPSGRWVMFSVVDVDLEKNAKVNHLWVVPVAGENVGEGDAFPLRNDRQRNERQITFAKEGESGGRFAPDGRHLLFIATDSKSGLSQIFVASWNDIMGTMGTPTRLTSVSTEADGAVWSPDSRRILFTSRVYPECSEGSSWTEEENCDRRKDAEAAANPSKGQVWDHLLYRHWDHYVGSKRSHVLVVPASDGNAVRDLTPRQDIGDTEAPTFSLDAPIGYAWAPDSQEIAYVTNLDLIPAASTNNDVFTLRLDEPGAKPVKISISPGSDDGPAYSPDGKYLAFRSQARAGYESDRFRLMLYDRTGAASQRASEAASQAAGGPAGQRGGAPVGQKLVRPVNIPGDGVLLELMPKYDRWVDEFAWGPDSKAVYLASSDAGRTLVLRFQFDGDPDEPIRIVSNDGEFSDLQVSRDGNMVVATRMSVDQPAEINLMRPGLTAEPLSPEEAEQQQEILKFSAVTALQIGGSSPRRQLTHFNDALLRTLDLPKQEAFRFVGAGGTPVQGFLLRPPNFDETRKYPVKFLIHGGPQGAWGEAWSYRWNPELMAASGYVVVTVNPRGSTGYGQAFIDGVNGDWGGKAYVDLMKGLDFAEKQYPFIDKTRECALGASYGGFMADWILTHTNRFACIVTHDGMFNPQSAYGTTEELWFNEWEFRASAAAPAAKGRTTAPQGGPAMPWNYFDRPAALDPFRKWSPMLSIKNAKTPTLVIHSQRDYRLDVSEGLQLFTALQRLNVPSKMLYFPDEGHWVLKPQNSKLWYETVGDWCDRWTKTNAYADGEPVHPVKARAAATNRGTSSTRMGVSRPEEMNEVQPSSESPAAAPPPAAPPVEAPPPAKRPRGGDAGKGTAVLGTGTTDGALPPVDVDVAGRAGTTGAAFQIQINARSNEVQTGSAAELVVTLKNMTEKELLFPHRPGSGNAEFSYVIVVRNAAGKVLGETAYGREARERQQTEARTVDYVQPGQASVQTTNLTRLVNLSRPGEYRVRVSRRDAVTKTVVESNEITLDVVP